MALVVVKETVTVDCAIAVNGKSSAASNAWRTTVTMKVRIMLNCGISN